MWLRKTDSHDKANAPAKLRYSRYYEHDGALRAYANRAMLLAFLEQEPTARSWFLALPAARRRATTH